MQYKILFIGVGSIAKRHIKNLAELLRLRGDSYQIDVLRSGKGEELDFDIKQIITNQYAVENNLPDYDIIFVTNPTSKHYETIQKYAKFAKHMFIEKPVFEDDEYDIDKLQLKTDSVYYVACPLRYTSTLQYIKCNIDCNRAIAVRCISSSYLPDWRPGTDYRNTYSAHRSMGGGVSIDLIHEWDYLSWLFGVPENVQSTIGKYSSLEIDSDDVAIYIGQNKHMTYELHLDYIGRKTLRLLQIFLPDETIEADLVNSRIIIQCQGKDDKIIDLSETRDAYQTKELEHFMDIVSGKCENDNDINNAIKILKITRGKAR